MAKLLFLSSVFAVLAAGYCNSCVNPEITSKSFTTQDATIVANIAYISEFSIKCSSGALSSLYAEVDGHVIPVSVVGQNDYQVSWTEDNKSARRGERKIRLFDETGYVNLKKALRLGELQSVPELFTVTVNHPGAYNGPWLKSEFIATVLSLVVAYFAIASRAKVVV